MRKISVATARLLTAFVGVALFVSTAFSAGEYQRTRDGKTLVWNSTPKAGDEATWFGDRDSEGYANGVGTLTWYTRSGTVYGRYFGNMVHGKLNGPVNVHLKGRTAHAVFTDGDRVTPWSTGPASSRPEVAQSSVTTEKKMAAAPTPKPQPTVAAKRESPSPAATPASAQIPAAGPSAKITRALPVSEAEQSPPAKKPTASAPVVQPASSPPDKPRVSSRQKSRSSFDPSLTALVGPPSSLRDVPANTELSEQQAIDLANGEARAQGYNLDDFQRPKADYSIATEKWTLFYEQKSADGAPQPGKFFTATVEDRSRKVVVGR